MGGSSDGSGMEEYRTDEFEYVGWINLDSRGRAHIDTDHAGGRVRVCVVELEKPDEDE